MEFFFTWLVLSGVVSYVASSRGRLALDYFLLSLFLSPLVGLVVLLAKPNLAEEARLSRARRQEQNDLLEALSAEERQNSAKGEPDAQPMFIADELVKLAELRDKGLLTAEEFQVRKEVLLK